MKYVVFPTQVEDMPVCDLGLDGKPASWQFLPEKAIRQKMEYNPRLEFLESLGAGDTVYTPLGGTGDAIKARALQQGAEVFCLPFNQINSHKAEPNGDLPTTFAQQGEKSKERLLGMVAMARLALEQPALFRQYMEVDQAIGALRVYTGQLQTVQDDVRKRLDQRITMLAREQQYLKRPEKKGDFAFDLIDSTSPKEVLLQYEHVLELAMLHQLRRIPVYTEVLEPVIGIGPRLAARIITPIVDIRRFPRLGGFRNYAGWDTLEITIFKCQQCDEEFPKWSEICKNCGEKNALVEGKPHRVARRFIRGESAQFHERLRMGVWLFGEQLVRNNSQFRWWYDGYKRQHSGDIGKTLYMYKDPKTKEMKPAILSPIWLERKARRKAASKFLSYVWFGWWELHGQTFTSHGVPFKAADLLRPQDHYPDDFFDPEEE